MTTSEEESMQLKTGLAKMLKGGVIMDVTTAEQARIAEKAGACAVMALERVPSDIRREGGVARMADPSKIREIQQAVTIPVMAKCRIGHSVESQILQALDVDFIDESEVLTPATHSHHIQDKHHGYRVPFVCGCSGLGEALRRYREGAAMLRTKGMAGTGDVSQAVTHMETIHEEIKRAQSIVRAKEEEGIDDEAVDGRLEEFARELGGGISLAALKQVGVEGRLPVVNFAAGGIATPADAALMMQLGADGVFVGSGIFKSGDPIKRARAIVQATTHFRDANLLAEISESIGEPMSGTPVNPPHPPPSLHQRLTKFV